MFKVAKKILVVFIIAACAGSTVYANVNDLATEALTVYNRLQEVETQKKEATGQQSKRISKIRSELKKISPEILSYSQQIQNYIDMIEEFKIKIAELQGKIDDHRKNNPGIDKPRMEQLSAEYSELKTKYNKNVKPFDKKIAKIRRIPKEKNAAYEKAMSKYCLIPGSGYPDVTKTNVNAYITGSVISYDWKDAKGKKLAWSHIRLRDKPKIPAKAKMLDNTYYITSHSNGSIWVWAGNFQVAFIMNKAEWCVKDNMTKAIKAFVDLEGLAKIDATPKAGIKK